MKLSMKQKKSKFVVFATLLIFVGSFFAAPVSFGSILEDEDMLMNENMDRSAMPNSIIHETISQAGMANSHSLAPCCISHNNEVEKAVQMTYFQKQTKKSFFVDLKDIVTKNVYAQVFADSSGYYSSSPPGVGLVSCVIKLE